MCRRFEEALAFHCGPALAGIKAANLVSLSRRDHPRCRELAEEYEALLSPRKIHLECLCSCGERVLLLVYREDCLARQLADPAVAAMLEQTGYPPGGDPAAMLGHLRRRLEAGGGFPHEMGLFLGYPPEDVRGFWENGGRNYKYSGVWKVYSDDVEGARAAFRRYGRCRDAICKRLARGISLVQMFRAA